MKKHCEAATKLKIRAADELTEITVTDSRFNHRASKYGYLEKNLEPGFFKVRWRTASGIKDRLIEITGNEKDSVLRVEPEIPKIQTSAPLKNTRFGVFDKPDVLNELLTSTPQTGSDCNSRLMIFLRDMQLDNKVFSANAITICSSRGHEIAKLDNGIVSEQERYAGINIGVDPGVYRVRVDTGALGTYEMFVSTAQNWQTQLFLMCDDFYYGNEIIRRPLLRTASILMNSINSGFREDNYDARLAEVALNSLLHGHHILDSNDMSDLLGGKFQDPMLGIYGAHLLLQQRKIDWGLYGIVCDNLKHLVGLIPDVLALLSQVKGMKGSDLRQIEAYYGQPPMLIHSWNLLVKQSRKRYSTIPQNTVSDRIAGSLVSTKPWLMSRVESQYDMNKNMPKVSLAEGIRTLKGLVNEIAPNISPSMEDHLESASQKLEPLENAILQTLVKTSEHKSFAHLNDNDFANKEEQLVRLSKKMISGLQAPSYSIARSTLSLASKLKDKFDLKI